MSFGAKTPRGAFLSGPTTKEATDRLTSSWPLSFDGLGYNLRVFRNILEVMRTEIDRALDAELYYPALVLAMSIPDICGALASADGKASGPRYAAWYESNLPDYAKELSGKDCHSMRSALVHQARPVKANMAYKQVYFPLRGMKLMVARGNVSDRGVIPDMIGIGLPQFCREVGRVASEWLEANKEDPNVVRNLPHVIQYKADAEIIFTRTGPILG